LNESNLKQSGVSLQLVWIQFSDILFGRNMFVVSLNISIFF